MHSPAVVERFAIKQQSSRRRRPLHVIQGESTAKWRPKSEVEPPADVADIPSQDLQAALDPDKRYFLVGPKISRQWTADQEIVWPTKTNPVGKMKFSTEEFVETAIEDVAKKHKIDRARVFTLSSSSSGPAAYAISLGEKRGVTGSFVAMSVFKPETLPPLKKAHGHAYYLYHSQQDRVCPYHMAEQAKNSLTENGAKAELATYEGGHGWQETFMTTFAPASNGARRIGRKPAERPVETTMTSLAHDFSVSVFSSSEWRIFSDGMYSFLHLPARRQRHFGYGHLR